MNTLIEKTALSHQGTRKDYQAEWEAYRYLIEDKMFIMVGADKSGRPIMTVKLDPHHGDQLRKTFPDQVTAGYYMNKVHWNSFYLDQPVDENIIIEAIAESYRLILQGFSKKRQKEILACS